MGYTAAGASSPSASTSLAVPVPAGVTAGDLILVYIITQAAGITFSDSGDGLTAVTAASGTNCSMQLLWRTATSADVALSGSSGSYTVTGSVAHFYSAICVDVPAAGGFGVFDPSTPASSGQVGATGNSFTGITGVTTASTGDLLLLFACGRTTSGFTVVISTPTAGYAAATGTGLTAGETLSPASGVQVGAFLATQVQATAGATGSAAVTWTSGSTCNGGGLIVAVTQPAAAVSPSAGAAAGTGVPPAPVASVGLGMTIQGA